MLDFLRSVDPENTVDQPQQNKRQEVPLQQHNNEPGTKKIKVGNREMTPEEYKQYLDFQRQFPDIDWEQDAMFTGYESQSVSTIPTPLRIK